MRERNKKYFYEKKGESEDAVCYCGIYEMEPTKKRLILTPKKKTTNAQTIELPCILHYIWSGSEQNLKLRNFSENALAKVKNAR